MARHDSARSFFRQVPNHLLARYSESRGLRSAPNFGALTPPQNAKRGDVSGMFGKTAAGPVEPVGGV